MLKRSFLTGLVILLPAVVTFWLVFLFINLVTEPFVNLTASILKKSELFQSSTLIFSTDHLIFFISKIIVLLAIVLCIFLVGILGRMLFLKWIGRASDYIIHRIPVVNKIYKGMQDLVHSLFNEAQTSFSSVVLVRFPHKDMMSIGLVTQSKLPAGSDIENHQLSVFVPGTPNPAMGFMLLFRPEEVIQTQIAVDEALKFVVSCGVICPEFWFKAK